MVKLSVMERVVLLTVLPKEDSFLTLKLIREAQSKLGLSAEEIKDCKIQQTGNKFTFDPEKIKEEKDIDLNDIVVTMIVEELKKLDNQKKLTHDHFTVYEKFVLKGG